MQALTSMVPASLRIKREETKVKPVRPKGPEVGAGFGLAPVSKPAVAVPPAAARIAAPSATTGISTDAKYMEFMKSMNDLGAFE